jgi:AcrR family transcriptional regulator
MREIAEESHIALGGIYNHFASKEAIFAAIIEERHPFLEIIPLLVQVEGTTTEDFVRNAGHRLVEELGHHPDFLNLMLIEIVEFKARHVPILVGRFLPLMAPLGGRIGTSRTELRPFGQLVLVRAFLGMFLSYYITDALLGPALPSEVRINSIDQFVDIFLRGVLKDGNA